MENNFSGAARIKVLGVGGGGNNAINNMIDAGIKSAEFVAINTDQQALLMSHAPNTLVIGKDETNGLGAGAEPSIGEKAALASRNEIREQLKNVNLLFITAGMGGGTGTGAAPIIASIANELGILTVAVVTKPFAFEGKRRMINAERGIENLRKFVDTLVVIPNQKLLEVLPQNTTMVEAFCHADEVLRKAIQGISDLIVIPSMINLDFADVRTIMRKKGLAHMGIGEAEGPDRMLKAVRQAVMSPLLETNIGGSSGIILNIVGGVSLTLNEVSKACKKVQEAVDESANIIFGAGIDETLGESVRITLIATGFGINENIDGYQTQMDMGQNLNLVPINSSMTNDEFSRRFDEGEYNYNNENQMQNGQADFMQNDFNQPIQQNGFNGVAGMNETPARNGMSNQYNIQSPQRNQGFQQPSTGYAQTRFVGNDVNNNEDTAPNGFFQQARPTLYSGNSNSNNNVSNGYQTGINNSNSRTQGQGYGNQATGGRNLNSQGYNNGYVNYNPNSNQNINQGLNNDEVKPNVPPFLDRLKRDGKNR